MKKEDFVSLECAKLLKEKGYNEQCNNWYGRNGSEFSSAYKENHNNSFPRDSRISMPTIYEAQKWLRGRGYYVEVGIYEKYVWAFVVYGYDDECCLSMVFSEKRYNTYEEALNAGIIEALKLI